MGSTEDEPWGAISALLREAAEFAPEEPVPGLLTSGGVALLLAQDAARQRRSIRARVALFATVLTGAAACSASLVLALNQSKPPVHATQPAPIQVTARVPVAETVTSAEGVVPSVPVVVATAEPGAPRRRRAVARTPRRRPERSRPWAPRPAEPSQPIWTEETVERQVTGVLAQAWVVQTREDGTLEIMPTLVDVPLTSDPAAGDPALSPAPATRASDAAKLEENEAR